MHPFTSTFHTPFKLSVTDVPPDLRAQALERTTEVLRQIDQVRRDLGLPVEHLPIVIETFSNVAASMLLEHERKAVDERTQRLPLELRSQDREHNLMKIPPGKVVPVLVRPQTIAFRPEEISIHNECARWVVHDIKVGNRSQFAGKQGPCPGIEFGPGGVCARLKLDVVQTAMDLVLEVEYVGPETDGEVFEATIVGSAIGH